MNENEYGSSAQRAFNEALNRDLTILKKDVTTLSESMNRLTAEFHSYKEQERSKEEMQLKSEVQQLSAELKQARTVAAHPLKSFIQENFMWVLTSLIAIGTVVGLIVSLVEWTIRHYKPMQ